MVGLMDGTIVNSYLGGQRIRGLGGDQTRLQCGGHSHHLEGGTRFELVCDGAVPTDLRRGIAKLVRIKAWSISHGQYLPGFRIENQCRYPLGGNSSTNRFKICSDSNWMSLSKVRMRESPCRASWSNSRARLRLLASRNTPRLPSAPDRASSYWLSIPERPTLSVPT